MISAVLIIKNAAGTLTATLTALAEFAEVICYDTGSTDNSLEIAAQFSNVRIIHGYFDGFGSTKNRAIAQATHDWIFSIDADEIPDSTLIHALMRFSYDNMCNVGVITRVNRFCGKPVHVGGWGNDKLVRLFNRRRYQFNIRKVHEAVHLDRAAQSTVLPGILHHEAVTDVGQFLHKIAYYSALSAQHLPRRPFGIILLKSVFAFFRSYVLKRGFTAGWRGFTIAYCNAIGVYFKYLRAYIDYDN